MDRDSEQKQLGVLMDWVTQRVQHEGRVPRLSDVVEQAAKGFGYRDLRKTSIARQLRLHPYYHMNFKQTRGQHRAGRHRPIVVNHLGVLHADIGYFSKSRHFETPPTFQAGYLIAKDVLSRFIYAVILRGAKKAETLIKAFEELLKQHQAQFGSDGHRIASISFDREPGIMSHKVQSYLSEKKIQFHAFDYSVSKAKAAEGAIQLLRTTMTRMLAPLGESKRKWWLHLAQCVASLNDSPIVIDGKRLNWRPVDINKHNLADFLADLYKAVPVQFFAQFDIAPQLVSFKYPVGAVVRPKLLVTSSAVIGIKRSEVNLEQEAFVVVEQIAYVARNFKIGRAYRCRNLATREEELFDEWDLAESENSLA